MVFYVSTEPTLFHSTIEYTTNIARNVSQNSSNYQAVEKWY